MPGTIFWVDDWQREIYLELKEEPTGRIQEGEHGVRLQTRKFRHRISWRDEFEKAGGNVKKVEDGYRGMIDKEHKYLVFW